MPLYWTFNCFQVVNISPSPPSSDFQILNVDVRKKGPSCPNWGQGGGLGNSGNARKKAFFFQLRPSLSEINHKRMNTWWSAVCHQQAGWTLGLWCQGAGHVYKREMCTQLCGDLWRGEYEWNYMFLLYVEGHLVWVVSVLWEPPERHPPNTFPLPGLIVFQKLSERSMKELKESVRTWSLLPHSLVQTLTVVRVYFLEKQPNFCPN